MSGNFIEVRAKMSIADKYKDFVDNKPTRQEYKMAQEALDILLRQRNDLHKQVVNLEKMIKYTRKFLDKYRNLV